MPATEDPSISMQKDNYIFRQEYRYPFLTGVSLRERQGLELAGGLFLTFRCRNVVNTVNTQLKTSLIGMDFGKKGLGLRKRKGLNRDDLHEILGTYAYFRDCENSDIISSINLRLFNAFISFSLFSALPFSSNSS